MTLLSSIVWGFNPIMKVTMKLKFVVPLPPKMLHWNLDKNWPCSFQDAVQTVKKLRIDTDCIWSPWAFDSVELKLFIEIYCHMLELKRLEVSLVNFLISNTLSILLMISLCEKKVYNPYEDSNSIDASSGWYLGNVQLKNRYKASGIRSIECPHLLYRNLRQVNCVKAHITTSPSYKKNTTLQQFHLFVRISPFLYLLSTTITNIHSWRPTTQIKLSEYKTVPDLTSAWKMN